MYVFVLILSVLFVLASAFFPVSIYSKTDLFEVKIGQPLAFIVQEQGGYSASFPWQTRLYSIWENPTQILWVQFFLDVAIVFGAIILVVNLVKTISLKTRRR